MQWHSQQVQAQVEPIDFDQLGRPMAEFVARYNRYYGLEFESEFDGVVHQVGSFEAAGFTLVAHIFKLEGAQGTVFLQHGYYDHVGLYSHIIRHCLEQGFNVFSYDLPGHGLSSGDRAGIDSFSQYDEVFCSALKSIQQYMPGAIVAMGQSTGGAVIVNYLLSRGLDRHTSPFEKIYLLAPLVRPMSWTSGRVLYYLVRPFIRKLKRTFVKNSHNKEFLRFISRQDPLQPLFLKTSWVGALKNWIKTIEASPAVDLDIQVIQGTEDGTVDYRHNMKVLKEKFRGFRVEYVDKGRHQLVNEEKQKLQQVLDVMTPLV